MNQADIPPLAYDYKNQAWLKNGKYVGCAHVDCQIARHLRRGIKEYKVTPALTVSVTTHAICYGTLHEGEEADLEALAEDWIH